jgi:proteasome alpha subunit
MATPYYVSPEQWYQDKAEYARKGIARGKPIAALECADGILMVAENQSASLRKLAEIYDRIGFAGVGKFDEYENLRKAGVRYADMRGYTFCREDVAAKNLANEYSTLLGSIFTREMKPFEVEILVAEVQDDGGTLYQVLYDGSIADHRHFAAIGGGSEDLRTVLEQGWKPELALSDALRLGVRALEKAPNGSADLDERNLEVALLERTRAGRKFRRLPPDDVRALLAG